MIKWMLIRLLFVGTALANTSAEGHRQPRFLFRTTITTTSTSIVSTSTACYTTTASLSTLCARRKKRAFRISQEPLEHIANVRMIEPSATIAIPASSAAGSGELVSSKSSDRDARFLQFYYTTSTITSTVTSTTVTSTTSFTLLNCLPSSFVYSPC
ncbi:hypothetical protein TCAL_12817 [Tigriopus californicus]|uniref:Uncharacterized protein n=1 Tax=Tigriopus californicus TaxID=6832 RepID=A0A553PT69_TIGCA|nr:uncharacterized protein LOC131891359 [Tigriopus californicus]TRY80866.1 hypothetical protein TCAL_12817 [Tigriopus californicus]|eukprot:TCALIF_12817-PA protein Name:"Protein of unknown function" AED:0.00 eAED:0.00 QI:105/1/1/1/0.33/0.5/4/5/155